METPSLIRLTPEYKTKSFICEDEDLNDFFLNDALPHYIQLLAVTYILENDKDTIAFFSMLNDKIDIKDIASNRKWNLFRKSMPKKKRYKSYPAVKIGRLGVHTNYAGKGNGSKILDFVKKLFVYQNRTGCRFITVDAYNQENVLKFYIKNDFQFLTEKDKQDRTRLMYYDLIHILD